MTQQECQVLSDVLKKITPKIRELVETKIAENLKVLNKETDEKLTSMVETLEKSVNSICNKLITDRDNLTEQINDIKQSIEVTMENQNKIINDEQKFSLVCN